jgi:hypothetical protein
MQDVFEPTANFEGEVFEPTANFGGKKSKLERRKNGLERLKNILKSNDLSNTQKQKINVAVSTGGVFAGLYLASRLLSNNKKSRFEGDDNFAGEVFEPMNFDGDYSNFRVDPNTVIAGATAVTDLVGNLAQAKAKRKEAEARLSELRGKRGAELSDCEKAKENRFALDPKKTKNRIASCKQAVNQKNDKEEAEQKEVVRKQLEIEGEKISLQKSSIQTVSADSKSKRNLILGASIGGGVLVLGTILFFVLRKK